MNSFLKTFILLLSLILFSEAALAARVAGTQIDLEPPSGFAPSAQFTGFAYTGEYNASIVITEIPAPVTEILKPFTSETLAKNGMTLLDSSKIKVDNADASLFHVSQSQGGQIYIKWILISGDEKHTVLINGIFPQDQASLFDAPIKRALLSTKWNAGTPKDVFEGLQFRVQPTAKLKIAGRISNYIILSESGQHSNIDSSEGRCFVGDNERSVNLSADRLAEFSKERLLGMRAMQDVFKDFSDAGGKSVQVDNVASYERLMNAVRRKNGEANQIYLVIIPYPNRFDEINCFAPASRMGELLPQFRQVTASFKRVP